MQIRTNLCVNLQNEKIRDYIGCMTNILRRSLVSAFSLEQKFNCTREIQKQQSETKNNVSMQDTEQQNKHNKKVREETRKEL